MSLQTIQLTDEKPDGCSISWLLESMWYMLMCSDISE